MNKSQLRAIVKADNARRAAREAQEDALLAASYSPCPEGVDPYLWDRGITGTPSQANRDYKASTNCWDRGMKGRTFGAAQDNAPANTVLVIRDNVSQVVPVSNFRPTRATHAAVRVQRSTAPPESAKLPAIANYSEQ